MQFWNEMEGRTIDGLFPLQRLIRVEGRRAWFETTTAKPASLPATLSLSESLTDADEIESRLLTAERLDDPSLVAISRVGRIRIDHTLFVYAVMEHIDQDLGSLLQNRPLTAEEARPVARALVGGLKAIHGQNLFHGRMEPASLLAIGEAVKLRSDCLQSPGGSQAKDIAGLGEILFQALTQRKPSSESDPAIGRLPAPFSAVVRNALAGRWNLRQIEEAVDPPAAPTPAAREAGKVVTAGARREVSTTEAAIQEPVMHKSANRISRLEPDDEGEGHRRRSAIYVVVAILVAIFIAWLVARPKAHDKLPANASQSNLRDPALARHKSSNRPSSRANPRIRTSRAGGGNGAVAATRPTTSEPGGKPAARSIWHVVAYTYDSRSDAQRRADLINKAHPGLDAQVFSPRGVGRPFLVTVGGSMDRGQAFAMRRKARAAGLPGDTYAQNFTH